MRGNTGDTRKADRGDPQVADGGHMGITVHVYCERGHRRRVVDEFQMWGEFGQPAPVTGMGIRPGTEHDARLCGGHPVSGCVRQWSWRRRQAVSSAVAGERRRMVAGLPVAPDGASAAARAYLERHPHHVTGYAAVVTDGAALDTATDKPQPRAHPQALARAAAIGPRRALTVDEAFDPYGMYTAGLEVRCTSCERIGANGGPRAQRLPVTQARLFDLLDTLAAERQLEVPLSELIQRNSKAA